VTDEARYRDIHARAPGLVEEQLINGMHVHVAVPSRAQGIEVMNRLRPDLPLLLAMSANSPFWQGRDSGFASWRSVHFERWPVEGPPPHFADEEDYDRRVAALLATGALLDAGQLYWEARVSERYPTVEIRCPDVQLRVDDAVLLAGLIRALVTTALDDMAADTPYPVPPAELMRATCWSAGRHGIDGDLYDVRQGRRRRSGDMIVDLLDRVQDALRASGDDEQVRKLADRLLRDGGGAARQRDVVRREGMGRLVDFLAAETVSIWPGFAS
jgi:carboxylate-amine ligase